MMYSRDLTSHQTFVNRKRHGRALKITLQTFRNTVFTLADGAKQSFSLRGKNRLRIFTLRLTGGAHTYHCSRRKQKSTSDINKALTGGTQRISLNQSQGDQNHGFSTADSHWLGTRACAVLAISLRCQSMFRYFTARLEILTLKLGEWGCHLSCPSRHSTEVPNHTVYERRVNKQNCRIWSEANPQVYVETPLHPKKLTVWCALWAGGIIGPYFFKNDEGHNVTVNGDRYRARISNFFIPELKNHDVQELWFQQDGATCHTSRATIDLLKDTFGDRLISRFGPVNWPPRSCDLTPLNYFLWGYVKSLVYADKPRTLDHLEDNIRRVIVDIRPQMLEKVIENWTSRLDYTRANGGSSMPEIIFKM
ncbi:putative DD41D transposase [Trichonephila clavipes]|nr:putative DD41D transposase [Trichonephila clavipes]